ncbi:MAG TPA: carboxypeptidase-like regulatory domain-containing protein, partial [Candidatus Acidoferrales bacterium]|nr:carboxypeptidase-like regulatory domain-containing protein [Candidatus Acidoferrales bacterium]
MTNRKGLVVGPFVLSCVLVVVPAALQAQTAAISGTVTDPVGAVVAGANVTVRNTQTNASRTTETNDTGYYRISTLVPSTYEISFEKTGFKTLHYSNVVLAVDQFLTLDAKLEVSAVAQTVEVRGENVTPIELENAQISNVVDSRRITDLPLILRDPYALIELSPGTAVSATRFGGFAVNGQSEKHNNFMLDGVDNNDTEVPGNPSGFSAITPESTQEFRLITNSFAPEYGRNSGAIVDIVTKSGTNEIRGNAYWFGRYSAVGARDFFNHQIDPVTGQVARQDPYVRNDFGASAGGPIIKNKTFWFGNYEGQRFPTTLTNTSTVPTAAFKTGKFTFNGQAVDLSPTSPNNASGSSLGTANLSLDPTIQKILALYPSPNGPATDDVRGKLFFPSPSKFNADLFTIKVDHNFTSNEVLSVRYTFNQSSSTDHNDFLPGSLGAVSSDQRTQSLSIGLTSTLKPSVINELRLGANRTRSPFNCIGQGVFDSFGFKDPLGRGSDFGMPASIAGFGCLALGDSNAQARYAGTYTYKDTLTKILGRHTFKAGAEFRPIYSNSFDDFGARTAYAFNFYSFFLLPSINLNPALGACNPLDEGPRPALFAAKCGSRTLQDMGWMLFGAVSTQAQNQFFDKAGNRTADDLRGFRQREVAWFVQDTFKALPNLTLTLGVRWEHYGVPFETHSNFSNLFANPSGPAPFTFTIVGPATGVGLYESDLRGFRNWEPRFGFAWDPFRKGKTSVRGGY